LGQCEFTDFLSQIVTRLLSIVFVSVTNRCRRSIYKHHGEPPHL
jgi:hypothetical protein